MKHYQRISATVIDYAKRKNATAYKSRILIQIDGRINAYLQTIMLYKTLIILPFFTKTIAMSRKITNIA